MWRPWAPGDMYSRELLDHFDNPRNVGELADADAEAESENPVCGDRLHVWLRIKEGKVERMSWRAEGCAPAIAAASTLSEMVPGLSVPEALVLDRESLTENLGGLPARKSHAAILAISALRQALSNIDRDSNPPSKDGT